MTQATKADTTNNNSRALIKATLRTDPELGFTSNGKDYANMSLIGKLPSGKTFLVGARKYGKDAESICETLRAGDTVSLEGITRQDRWTTPEGVKRSAVRVVVFRMFEVEPLEQGVTSKGNPIGLDATNSVTLTGYVQKDVIMRYSPQGTAYLNFSIAVNDGVYQGQTQTSFYKVSLSEDLAIDNAELILEGALVTVIGCQSDTSYINRDGDKVNSNELTGATVVVMAAPKPNAVKASTQESASEAEFTELSDDDFEPEVEVPVKAVKKGKKK